MKKFDVLALLSAVKSCDARAGFRRSGIAACGEHNTGRSLVGPLNINMTQSRLDHSVEYIHKICLKADQNRLRFRIAKAHVVFKYAWPIGGEHQTSKENAAE